MCVIPLPQQRAGCSQRGASHHQKRGGFGLMSSLSPPDQASPPALLAGDAKSLLACSETAGADAGGSPTAEHPSTGSAPAPPRTGTKLMLPPRPCCFWVARGETGPSASALPIPASGPFPRAGAGSAHRGGSQAWEGKSRHRQGRGGGGTTHRAQGAVPSTHRQHHTWCPKPAIGV